MATALQLGVRATNPLQPAEGLPLLAQAEDRRSVLFEELLLLSDMPVIDAARRWQEAVWELHWFVDGSTPKDHGVFKTAFELADQKRAIFYEYARRHLQVAGALSPTQPYPWRTETTS
jgi:hypothetical protein